MFYLGQCNKIILDFFPFAQRSVVGPSVELTTRYLCAETRVREMLLLYLWKEQNLHYMKCIRGDYQCKTSFHFPNWLLGRYDNAGF